MNLRIYVMTGAIALILSGIFLFFDKTISFGIMLATVFSLINMCLLSLSMKQVMKQETPSMGMMMAGNMIRFLLLFGMLYVAYRLQNIFSMIGIAIGVTLFMIALLIDAMRKKKGR